MNKKKFTEEDVDNCWEHCKFYLMQILNNEYSIEDARDDLRSLIGSKYDKRNFKKGEKNE